MTETTEDQKLIDAIRGTEPEGQAERAGHFRALALLAADRLAALTTPQEGDAREWVADRLARAFDGNDGDDLGAAQGEGALHLALAFPIREAIEDVYADCGDSDTRVLSTNIAQRLAWLLTPAILAAFPALSRAAAPEPEWEYGLRRAEPSESGIPWYAHTTSDTLDGVTAWKSKYDELVRRRKAGPWQPLPVADVAPAPEASELFPGTTDALDALTIRKGKQ